MIDHEVTRLRRKSRFMEHLADRIRDPAFDNAEARELRVEMRNAAGELEYLSERIEWLWDVYDRLIDRAQKADDYDDLHEGFCDGERAARNEFQD